MEAVVDGTPKACLTKAFDYLKNDWQFGGTIYRAADNVRVVETKTRTLMDSGPGFLLIMFLGLITGGIFLVGYFIYFLLFRESDPWQVQLSALPGGSGTSRLTVTATKRRQGTALEEWVQRELVQNRAAAPGVFDKQELQEHLFGGEPARGGQGKPIAAGIPEQIKKLADLRDSGAITTEEFEAKKKDLLDRM